MNKLIFFVLAVCLNTQAAPLAKLSIPKGVFSELEKFSIGDQKLPADYVSSLPTMIHQKMMSRSTEVLSQLSQNCSNKVKVSFPGKMTAVDNAVIQSFESSLSIVEVQYCFNSIKPSKIVSHFADPAFQKRAISTIKSYEIKSEETCQKSSVLSVGTSDYCFKAYSDLQDQSAAIVSFNTWNESTLKANAPIYFREVLVSSKKINDKMTAFHFIAYVRGPNLSGLQKTFGKGFVEQEQNNLIEKAKAELGIY